MNNNRYGRKKNGLKRIAKYLLVFNFQLEARTELDGIKENNLCYFTVYIRLVIIIYVHLYGKEDYVVTVCTYQTCMSFKLKVL